MNFIEYNGDLNQKIASLKKIGVNGEKWEKYYLDEQTGEKWIEDYPQSELQGGGPPRLRMVDSFPDGVGE